MTNFISCRPLSIPLIRFVRHLFQDGGDPVYTRVSPASGHVHTVLVTSYLVIFSFECSHVREFAH